MSLSHRSHNLLHEIHLPEIVPVTKSYLVDSFFNALQVEASHSPDLLQLAINQHGVRVRSHSCLFCEYCLFIWTNHEEGDRLLRMLGCQLRHPVITL